MLVKKLFLFLFLFVLCFSCKRESQLEKEIAKIDMSIAIERFDLAFGDAKPENLSKLKDAFPFMFSKKYADSFWVKKMLDTFQIELNKETKKVFPNLNLVEEEIEGLCN